MRRSIVVAVLGLAAACGGSGADSGLPPVEVISTDANAQDEMAKFSPDGSQIAFYRPGERGWQLWVANADMGEARGLDAWAQGNVPVIWSPDGSMVAIGTNARGISDLAVVSVATGELTFLTDTPAYELPIQFSADGSQVVYAAFGNGTVFGGIAAVDGSGARPFLPGMTTESYLGFLSPDGTQYAHAVFEGNGRSTLWVADADGGNRRQLTTEGFEQMGGLQTTPWSPDGTELLYFSTRTGRNDIWALRVADGTTRQITSDIRDDLEATWSPDGGTIAFISTRGRQRDVWLVPAAGGEPVRVTDDRTEEEFLGWRDDGTLFYSAGGSPGSIWQRSLTDGSEMRITPDSVDPGDFFLSPDRSQIAFAIDLPSGDRDVAVMPASGGDHRILSTGGNNISYRWNPAGTMIAFETNRLGNSDVWVVPADGSAPARAVTDWPGFEQLTGAGWTADGMALIIQADRNSVLGEVWRVPLDGGEATQLTSGTPVNAVSFSWAHPEGEMVVATLGDNAEFINKRRLPDGTLEPWKPNSDDADIGLPGWSEDGERYVFSLQLAGRIRLEVRNHADNALLGTVTDSLGRVGWREFSPDGSQLLTFIRTDGNSEVGLFDIATGVHTRLTNTRENEPIARWAADGESIILRRVFVSQQVMVADVSGLVGVGGE